MSAGSNKRKPLAAVILSGGASRRMGSPKALVEWKQKTFAERLIEATRHPRVGITRIVVGAHQDEIRRKRIADPNDIVLNANWRSGQLSSIQAGIRSLPPGGTSGMILCPVDHPMVFSPLLAQLIDEFDSSGKPIVLPKYHGRRGHPVIFRASLYEELLDASDDVGARQVVWAHADEVLEVPTDQEGVVININDRKALEEWISKLETKGGVSP
jgi:molybdenum cofactor cytidylyltransferase